MIYVRYLRADNVYLDGVYRSLNPKIVYKTVIREWQKCAMMDICSRTPTYGLSTCAFIVTFP